MTFSWKKQLEIGQAGEHLLINGYHSPIVFSHNLRWDFTRISDGAKIEVKTDTYDHEATPNFFFERWGNEADRKPGGPWRARKDRVDVFVYFFVRNNIYYEFNDVKVLCARADKLIRRKSTEEIRIKNRGYITVGYKLPRDEFKDLFTVHRLEETSVKE